MWPMAWTTWGTSIITRELSDLSDSTQISSKRNERQMATVVVVVVVIDDVFDYVDVTYFDVAIYI